MNLDWDDELMDRRIVDMSEEELISLGYLGDKANPHVRRMVEFTRENPDISGDTPLLLAYCLNEQHSTPTLGQDAARSSGPPSAATYSEMITNPEAHTVIPPHLVSEFERRYYYHGIYGNPELIYRSDLETNPFPIPPPGTPFSDLPTKTPNGVFGTPLNEVWDDKVSPRIMELMEDSEIRWSSLTTARFTTVDQQKSTTVNGPVVIWIGLHSGTFSAGTLRDVTPNILQILSDVDIHDVVVEWYDGGEVRRL